MWEFLGRVLEQHGLAAVVILATYGAGGYAMRELWKRANSAQDALAKAKDAAADSVAQTLREEHEKRRAMREEHEKEISELKEQMKAEARYFAERMESLHEKRNDELREVLREGLTHMGETRASVEKITEVMQTLRDVVRGGGR